MTESPSGNRWEPTDAEPAPGPPSSGPTGTGGQTSRRTAGLFAAGVAVVALGAATGGYAVGAATGGHDNPGTTDAFTHQGQPEPGPEGSTHDGDGR